MTGAEQEFYDRGYGKGYGAGRRRADEDVSRLRTALVKAKFPKPQQEHDMPSNEIQTIATEMQAQIHLAVEAALARAPCPTPDQFRDRLVRMIADQLGIQAPCPSLPQSSS